jgi:hypothetical protein
VALFVPGHRHQGARHLVQTQPDAVKLRPGAREDARDGEGLDDSALIERVEAPTGSVPAKATLRRLAGCSAQRVVATAAVCQSSGGHVMTKSSHRALTVQVNG